MGLGGPLRTFLDRVWSLWLVRKFFWIVVSCCRFFWIVVGRCGWFLVLVSPDVCMDVSNLFDMSMVYAKYVHEIEIAPYAILRMLFFKIPT